MGENVVFLVIFNTFVCIICPTISLFPPIVLENLFDLLQVPRAYTGVECRV